VIGIGRFLVLEQAGRPTPKGQGCPERAEAYMNRQTASALKRIETVSRTLNQTSDQLSEKIVEIESHLNEYKLGVWAWLEKPLSEQIESDEKMTVQYTIITSLGYGKIREKWGFVISVYPDYDPSDPNLTFLKDTSREIRAEAIDRIPELLECIAEKAAKLSEKIAEKAELADEIAASLKKTS
jgi:hypothetical protein